MGSWHGEKRKHMDSSRLALEVKAREGILKNLQRKYNLSYFVFTG